jgi:hypothetical protein
MEWSSNANEQRFCCSEVLIAMVMHGAKGFRLNAAKPDVFEEHRRLPARAGTGAWQAVFGAVMRFVAPFPSQISERKSFQA